MKKNKLNIALVHPLLDMYGGAERQILNLLDELIKKGHNVTLYTYFYDEKNCYPNLVKKLKKNIVSVSDHSSIFLKQKYLSVFFPFFFYKIYKKMKKGHLIINCHNPPSYFSAFLYKKINTKAKIFWMFNELSPWHRFPLRNWWKLNKLFFYPIKLIYLYTERKIVESVDNIIVLDRKNKKIVKDTFNRDSIVVHTGFEKKEVDKEIKNKIIDRYKLKNKKVILTVSKLEPLKRIDDFIRSFLKLKNKNVIGIIGGSGSELNNLKKLIKKLNLSERIIFTGSLSEDELAALYEISYIFVFPAVKQTWGLAPVEAMSYGKPAVISSDAGVSEIIKNKENGFIFEAKSVSSLVKNINYLLNNKKMYEKISKNARDTVFKELSWEKYSQNILEIFARN
ncbi:MAG: hypothetical protein AUK08_01665 [Candidatus Pacebacteria bacterium CG2_30_36_39]|nr:MAG: hypothetical protein AUK08_01665 [Candidatus Pacebacteria bacterium CG2_30_36_39]